MSKYPHVCLGPDPCKKCAAARRAQWAEHMAKEALEPPVQWPGETGNRPPEFGFYAGGRTR